MSKSLSFRLQLSSIMEITTKTAIEEICKIVDSDFAFLRQELSRVMSENTVLKDEMLCLGSERQNESTRITKGARAGSKKYRSICVQTEDGKYNLCLNSCFHVHYYDYNAYFTPDRTRALYQRYIWKGVVFQFVGSEEGVQRGWAGDRCRPVPRFAL